MPTPNPDVDITTTTDNTGLVIIPGLPPDSANRYAITATYAGYSTDLTYADPPGAQTAVQLNANVLVQQITSVVFSIDQQSLMNISIVDTSGAPIVNQALTITGSKKIYQNPDVYKYNQTVSSDASGLIALSNMEFDAYKFTPPSGKYIVSVSPFAPVGLNPGTTQAVTVTLSSSSSYPTITSASPSSAATGTSAVAFTVNGTNLNGSTILKIAMAGQPDITATGVSVTGTTKLTGTFNLAGAATGAWNIVVGNGGNTAIQTGGFNVTP